MIKNPVVIGMLMGALLSTQVFGGESACLTRNRLVSSRAINENTIEMVDRLMNRFIVRMERRAQISTTRTRRSSIVSGAI
jgi:hypothetical protein